MYVARPVIRDQIVTRSCERRTHQRAIDGYKGKESDSLTPHSEKHKMLLPSGAHSALTKPSAPDSILASQVSSLSLKTLTTPRFAHAASMYSESFDQAMWDIQPSCVTVDDDDDLPRENERIDVVADGDVSTSHVRAIWKVSDRRTTRRSWTAVRMNWAPGLNATRFDVCL